ncbi:MAG: electron transfer flavoprotein subunit beta/FixA family protein [Betaproteobacteria bacterium]
MRLFVLLKQVPGTSEVKLDGRTGTMLRTEHNNVINPLDENALEEALRIKAHQPDVHVTAVSMGPSQAVKALREALALGADEACLLSDRAFAGSDTLATARALSRALSRLAGGTLGPGDLVLCGERATDGETGQVGPMVASLLDVPVATFVRRLDVRGSEVTVERVVEDGFERVALPLPALVTVVKDINQPGFPTLDGKLAAREAPIELWTATSLGLTSGETGLKGSPTRVVRVFRPSLARNGVLRTQEPDGRAVDELLAFLTDRGLI